MARHRDRIAAGVLSGVLGSLLGCGPQRNLSIVPALPTSCSPVGVNELTVTGLGDFPPLPNTLSSATRAGGVFGALSLELPRGTQVVTVQGVGESATTFGRSAPLQLPSVWSAGGSHAIALNYGAPDTFCPTASLIYPRSEHQATLLLDGSVLLSGGVDPAGAGVSNLERYLPAGDASSPVARFADLGAQIDPQSVLGQSATRLADGRVFLSGGAGANLGVADGIAYAAAQVLTSSATIDGVRLVSSARAFHGAVLLADGRVLLAGGCELFAAATCAAEHVLASAVLFDPSSNAFTAAPALLSPRWGHQALLRDDGLVLIVGGLDGSGFALQPELYDPTEARGTALAGPAGRAVVLDSGLVIGTNDAGGPTAITLAWSGDLDAPQALPELPSARSDGTLTALEDGTVLFAGGWDGSALALSSAILAGDGVTTIPLTGFLAHGHSATRLYDGSVLLAGGTDAAKNPATPAIFLRSLVGPFDSPPTENFESAPTLTPSRPGDVAIVDGELVVTGDTATAPQIDDYALVAGPVLAGPSTAGFTLDVLAGHEASAQAALLFGAPGQSSYVAVVVAVGAIPSVQQVTVSRPGIVSVSAQAGCSGVAVTDADLPVGSLTPLTFTARNGKVELRSPSGVLLRCNDSGWPARGEIALGARNGNVHYDNVALTR